MAVIENTTALFQGIIEQDSTLVSHILGQDKTEIGVYCLQKGNKLLRSDSKRAGPQGIPNSMFRKQELCLYWGTGDL